MAELLSDIIASENESDIVGHLMRHEPLSEGSFGQLITIIHELVSGLKSPFAKFETSGTFPEARTGIIVFTIPRDLEHEMSEYFESIGLRKHSIPDHSDWGEFGEKGTFDCMKCFENYTGHLRFNSFLYRLNIGLEN